MAATILVVDDDAALVDLIAAVLSAEGYRVIPCPDPRHAQRLAVEHDPELAILDVVMPGIDGISLCRALRERSRAPIIFLSAKDDPADRAIALRIGGDDYLTKPFETDELLARVGAHLRRATRFAAPAPRPRDALLAYPGFVLDDQIHAVTVGGRELGVTATEYRILRVLLAHPNQVLTREDLVDELERQGAEIGASAVPVHLRRLRRKVGLAHGPTASITTVRGFGYRFVPPGSAVAS